jgi:hypothetical protein
VPAPEDLEQPFGPRWWTRARPIVKSLIIVAMFGATAVPDGRNYFKHGDGAPRAPLSGAFEMEELRRDGEVAPPLLTDPHYLRYVVFVRDYGALIAVDGTRTIFRLTFDDASGHGKLVRLDGRAELGLVRAADDRVGLEGTLDGVAVQARARRVDEKHELLLRRGFHWINEAPFNR